MIVGAVLSDFIAAIDVIDHKLLLKKLSCYGFTASAITWLESYLSNRTQCSSVEASLTSDTYFTAAALRRYSSLLSQMICHWS